MHRRDVRGVKEQERVPVRMEDNPRTATLRLRSEATSVRAARRFVASQLERWRWRGDHDPVVLLTSEVVSNGIAHAASPLTLTVTLDGDAVRVSLHDGSDRQPVVRPLRLDAERGRGLVLVEALSRRWGVEAIDDDGKAVWFEVKAR